MRYQIDSDTLNKTTKCKNGFSCLQDKKDCLCEIKKGFKIDGSIMIINPLNNNHCDYMKPLGESWICNCPTREAIYRKYKM